MNNENRQQITVDLDELVGIIKKYDSQSTESSERQSFGVIKPKVSEDLELNIRDIFSAVLRRWWIIALAMVFGAIAFFGMSYRGYAPQYTASAKMYVNNDNLLEGQTKVSISTSDITAAQSLVDSYCEILTSHLTLDEVIKLMKTNDDYNLTYDELFTMISCGSVNETEVFYISVTDTDPQRAVTAVNTIVDVLPSRISTVVDGASVKTVDRAVVAKQVDPGFTKKILLGALFGAIVSCAYAILRGCVFNDVIESSDWLNDTYENIPVLAEIPDIYSNNNKNYYNGYSSYTRGGTK